MSEAGSEGRWGLPSRQGSDDTRPGYGTGSRLGDFGLVITQRPFGGPFGSHYELISFLIAPKTY